MKRRKIGHGMNWSPCIVSVTHKQYGDLYVFFVTGTREEALLAVASRVEALDRVPTGTFAMVTDDEAEEFGTERRGPSLACRALNNAYCHYKELTCRTRP